MLKCHICGKKHPAAEHANYGAATTVTNARSESYVAASQDDGSVRQGVNPSPVPGEPCPTCGRVVAKYKDNAARQAAYRKRKGEA